MSLHVEVSSDVDVVVSHDLIDKIETDIKEKYNLDLVIHMDPIDPDNAETILMMDKVQNALLSISKDLSMHDFRIIKEKNHNKAIFEIVVPFDCKLSHDEILRQLNTILEIDNLHISLEPTFETPFVEQ
jgi:divalent metal cation (Fe/Co/Zn/Cd) transporter